MWADNLLATASKIVLGLPEDAATSWLAQSPWMGLLLLHPAAGEVTADLLGLLSVHNTSKCVLLSFDRLVI